MPSASEVAVDNGSASDALGGAAVDNGSASGALGGPAVNDGSVSDAGCGCGERRQCQ